jgi:RHS repeat-associated protein
VTSTWSASFDSLNRLAAVKATSGPYSGEYGCWTYDAFGNRTLQAVSNAQFTAVSGNNCQAATDASLTTSWATYAANNWITGTNTAPGGDAYDASGDVVADGVNQYLYDAEGRICAVTNTALAGTTMTGYLYDADGARVAKGAITSWSCDPTVNGFTTTSDYVLGPGGEQMTEMDMGANNTMAWQHTNVWVGNQLMATYDKDGLHFHFTNWLGSRRAQADYAGVMEQTCASLPYGDSLNCTLSIQNPTEHHFTGKERDVESGNDYFGARYYASTMGRWLSPDWSAKVEPVPYAKIDDPQSFNLYGYVGNSPMGSIDIDGHQQQDEPKSETPAENPARETEDLREMKRYEDYKEDLARYKEAEAAARNAPRLSPAQEAQLAEQFGQLEGLALRYLSGSGGRWGSNLTRRQNYYVAQSWERLGLRTQWGGGTRSEEYIPGIGGGPMGSTYVDITMKDEETGLTVRIQTVDTDANGNPTQREQAAIGRIQKAFPKDVVLWVPKWGQARPLPPMPQRPPDTVRAR